MWEESALLLFRDLSQKEKFPSLRRKKWPPFHMITLHWHGQEAVAPHVQQMDRHHAQERCSIGSQMPSRGHFPKQNTHTHTHVNNRGPLASFQTDKMKDLCWSGFLPPGRIKEEAAWRWQATGQFNSSIVPNETQRRKKNIYMVSLKYKKQDCSLEENAI